jgi:ABC-2 type transport system permease protein
MKLLSISIKDTKALIRDRRALIILIAMPLVIISILGLALSNIWSGDAAINKFDVGVVNQDGGSVAKSFINDILKSTDMQKMLNVRPLSETEARRLVSNGDLAAVVIIPSGFTKRVTGGQTAQMKVLADPGQQIRAGIVRSVTDSFASHVSSVMIGTKTPLVGLLKAGVIGPANVNQAAGQIAIEAQRMQANPQLTVAKQSAAAAKQVNALQYYSAGMGVMFILFGSMYGAFSLLDERRQMTLARLLATPTSKISILGGKLGGVFLIGILQFTVLVAVTRLLFGVHWGNSIPAIIALMAATVFAATGMSIFIAAIAKTHRSVAAISQLLIQGMAVLGGSMIPLMSMPKALQAASKFTINNWAISGFNSLMLDKGLSSVVANCGVLAGIGLVFLALGVWRFKYE